MRSSAMMNVKADKANRTASMQSRNTLIKMRFDFDLKKIQHEVERTAEKAYFETIERARRSLGTNGKLVTVRRLSSPRRQGSCLTFGDVSFPSEEVKRRFEEALVREMR